MLDGFGNAMATMKNGSIQLSLNARKIHTSLGKCMFDLGFCNIEHLRRRIYDHNAATGI